MTRNLGYVALLIAALFWGIGNIPQKLVLDHIGPLSAVCLRCLIAACLLAPFAAGSVQHIFQPGYVRSVLLVAGSFALALAIQQFAYLHTTVTNACILVNISTVLTPVIAWLALRETPDRCVFGGALLTFLGVILMSKGGSWASFNIGDIASLVAALFYALWMIALGRHVKNFGTPGLTAAIQFVFTAIVTAPALVMEELAKTALIAAMPDLLVLGVFATAAAYGLQALAQRVTSASRAAVIVSSESLFGATGAFVLLGERPEQRVIFGGLLILSAIVIVSFTQED